MTTNHCRANRGRDAHPLLKPGKASRSGEGESTAWLDFGIKYLSSSRQLVMN